MPKVVFDNRVGIGTVVAITLAVSSLIGGYAIYGKTTVENKKTLEVVVPSISLNTNHRLDNDVHMPFQEKVKVFVPRTEFDVVKDDIKEIKAGQKEVLRILISMK